MAGRRGIGDGAVADALARLHERRAARLLGSGFPAVECGLRPVLQLYWLAWHAVDRCSPGALGLLHPQIRQGAARLAGEPTVATPAEAGSPCAAHQHLQAWPPPQHADGLLVDGEQLRRLLLDLRALRDASSEGSEPQPGLGRDTARAREPRGIPGNGLVGLVCGPLRPPMVND